MCYECMLYIFICQKFLKLLLFVMISNPVHIGPKGQIVLPKAIRLALNTNNIVFEIIDDIITIKPVRNVAGSLSHHSKSYTDFSQVREQAWLEAADER